ncbi:hypothetical protein B0H11DRAFT_1906484 [Mycena galericulata]|nr:hypothetical protein B0H11DRAFT_1906484 [Mycena galericulata]
MPTVMLNAELGRAERREESRQLEPAVAEPEAVGSPRQTTCRARVENAPGLQPRQLKHAAAGPSWAANVLPKGSGGEYWSCLWQWQGSGSEERLMPSKLRSLLGGEGPKQS